MCHFFMLLIIEPPRQKKGAGPGLQQVTFGRWWRGSSLTAVLRYVLEGLLCAFQEVSVLGVS